MKLGAPVAEYEPLFSSNTTRTTEAGICQYDRGMSGAATALVGFLTDDRRLAGKLRARATGGGWGGSREPAYVLEGEIAPGLYLTQEVGPVDTLRHAAGSLLNAGDETVSRSAYELVCAGLIRLIERWPKAGLPGADARRVGEISTLAPSTGDASITIMSDGGYRFSYVAQKKD